MTSLREGYFYYPCFQMRELDSAKSSHLYKVIYQTCQSGEPGSQLISALCCSNCPVSQLWGLFLLFTALLSPVKAGLAFFSLLPSFGQNASTFSKETRDTSLIFLSNNININSRPDPTPWDSGSHWRSNCTGLVSFPCLLIIPPQNIKLHSLLSGPHYCHYSHPHINFSFPLLSSLPSHQHLGLLPRSYEYVNSWCPW